MCSFFDESIPERNKNALPPRTGLTVKQIDRLLEINAEVREYLRNKYSRDDDMVNYYSNGLDEECMRFLYRIPEGLHSIDADELELDRNRNVISFHELKRIDYNSWKIYCGFHSMLPHNPTEDRILKELKYSDKPVQNYIVWFEGGKDRTEGFDKFIVQNVSTKKYENLNSLGKFQEWRKSLRSVC